MYLASGFFYRYLGGETLCQVFSGSLNVQSFNDHYMRHINCHSLINKDQVREPAPRLNLRSEFGRFYTRMGKKGEDNLTVIAQTNLIRGSRFLDFA